MRSTTWLESWDATTHSRFAQHGGPQESAPQNVAVVLTWYVTSCPGTSPESSTVWCHWHSGDPAYCAHAGQTELPPEGVNWPQHRIASTNTHPISMGAEQSASYGTYVGVRSSDVPQRWSKMVSKLACPTGW